MKLKVALMVLLLFVISSSASAQQKENSPANHVKWQRGPCIGDLGDMARIQIPAGYIFAGGHDTRVLMEAMHNPTSGNELGLVAREHDTWYLVFEFDDTGYIKDDEKNSLDPDAMLDSIRKATVASNRERAKRGWPTISVTGWAQPPRYNAENHNLEWAITGASENHELINWNTRLLGRSGVMRVTLVTDQAHLSGTMPYYQRLIDGFSYKTGHRYAEFRQGDKIAKYGLTALVVGGATAVAVKTGLLKYIWKILIVGFAAVAGFLKKLFSRRKTEGTEYTKNE